MSEQFMGFSYDETADGDVVPREQDIDVRFTRDDVRANLANLLALHPEHSHEQDGSVGHTEQAESDELDKPLTPHQKAFILRNDFGFDAYSARERNEAMENVVQKFPGKHLNEVLRRQQKLGTEDPAAALRSIVNEYAGYAKAAKSEAGILGLVLEDLDLTNPTASLNSVLDLDEGTGRRVVSALKSQIVYDGFLTSEGETAETVDKLSDEEAAALSADAAGIEVSRVKDRLRVIIARQEHRYNFWVEHLKGAKEHYAIRHIARQALNRLGIEDIN